MNRKTKRLAVADVVVAVAHHSKPVVTHLTSLLQRKYPRQPKISKLYVAGFIDEKVLRLEVSVNYTVAVAKSYPLEKLRV